MDNCTFFLVFCVDGYLCALLGLLPYNWLSDLLAKTFPNLNLEHSVSLLVLILLLPK